MFIVLNHKEGSYLVYTLMSILPTDVWSRCVKCVCHMTRIKHLGWSPIQKYVKWHMDQNVKLKLGYKTETCRIDWGPKIVKLIWAQIDIS